MVERGQYGLVYIPHKEMFAYYDDDDVSQLKRSSSERTSDDHKEPSDGSGEGELTCIIYRDGPMRGPCYEFPQCNVRKPPFDGHGASQKVD